MARPSYSDAQIREMENRIRAAALRVFARTGNRDFSLRAVAAEMGMTPPALYRYVDNKEQLIDELRAEGFRRLAGRFEAVERVPGASRQAVRAILRTYLDFALDESDLYRLMYEFDQGAATAPAWVRAIRQRTFDTAHAAAVDFAREHELATDPLQLVHLWWIGLHGLAALDLAAQLDMGCDRDALIEPLLDLLLNTAGGKAGQC